MAKSIRKKADEVEREQEVAARHREDEMPPNVRGPAGSASGGVHAVGGGGGGTAIGGMAGANEGAGTPDMDQVEEAAGSGQFDVDLEKQDEPPYAGHSGGAVGGTPAGKRASGGKQKHGFSPDRTNRGDSTIGKITSRRRST